VPSPPHPAPNTRRAAIPSTTLWNKGASTTLVVRGNAYPECSPAAEEVSSARGNDPADPAARRLGG
jgi:hypothetical protein